MSFVAIIPARYGSTRFPGKPLIHLGGVPMVVRTAYRVAQAGAIERVVVATDDKRIAAVCAQYDLESIMTSSDHATGTDRIVEASRILKVDKVVNVQGDEPLVEPACIDQLVGQLLEDPEALVANVACPLADGEENDPNIVSAVPDQQDRMMFLSRCPVPFSWGNAIPRLRHLGLYAFREGALERYASRQRGPVERAERIEMFRFLEYGDAIALAQVPPAPPAVDVPDDVQKVEAFVMNCGGWSHCFDNLT